ncbi:MAG TPA: hypothetical protein VMT61_01980 [Candidatus Binataceae bacterium]|nr:hypothetical protein [Candidatus Binataceae bacterium]
MQSLRVLALVFLVSTLIALAPNNGGAQSEVRTGAGQPPDSCSADATVTEPTSGVWSGYVVLKGRCGADEARLYYHRGTHELRYEIATESLRDGKPAPITIRNRLLGALLSHLFAAFGKRPSYSFATNAFPEVQERMAADAAASAQWNRITGRPRAQVTSAGYVKSLLNQKSSYREIEAVFGDFDYAVRVASVEQVSTLRFIEMSPTEKAFIHEDLDDNDKLPTGAAIFYRIERR